MKKDKKSNLIIYLIAVASFFIIPLSYALYKNSTYGNSQLASAVWSVSLNQTDVENELTIIPEIKTDSYTLNVSSLSEVDITYDIVISDLPPGVSVALNDGTPLLASNGTVTFTNADTILYNANNKTSSKTLTFSAENNATTVSNQTVTINVIAKQLISN